MFPSTQTWVLGLVMLSLTYVKLAWVLTDRPSLTDWVSFLVLDLGNP